MILDSTMAILHPHRPLFSARNHLALMTGLFLLLVVWQTPALAMPKTDVITLENGDVITCEIKEMVRGKLQVKTDHMGTLYIEWEKVVHITSTYWFLISVRDGSLVYGQLDDSEHPAHVAISFQERSRSIPMDSIVEIQPIRYSLWDRFAMSASIGFNWNKGSGVFQANTSANVKYSGTIYNSGLDLSTMTTTQGDDETTRRNQFDLWLQREISGKLNGNGNTGYERNDELGLRARISAGLNVGYFLARSNHLELLTWLGGSLNQEWATEDSDPTQNAEGDIGASFNMFYFDSPKSDISVVIDVYPSFTESGRRRFEGKISGSQEIINDLAIKLEYYESRDSKPPSGANATSDRGIIFSIEWRK